MKTLFVLHLTGLATAAYFLNATMVDSMNVISTGPPSYPIHALDAALYFLLQVPPGVTLLLTSAVVLGSHARSYLRYYREGLQVACTLMGMAILHTELVFLLGKAASDLSIWL